MLIVFFELVQNFREERGKKFNTDDFAAFQLVYWGLYSINSKFTVKSDRQFTKNFMKVYTKLTGKVDSSLDNKKIVFEGERNYLKLWFRKNMKKFSNGLAQTECFEQFMKLTTFEELGVVFREEKRSMRSDEREEHLALQGYKCAIDGGHLDLNDSVLGHDTAWSRGGKLEDGAVIRRSHNIDMGTTTLEEYRIILETRKQNA